MNVLKKSAALAVAAAITVMGVNTNIVSAAEIGFSDVPADYWAHDCIVELAEKGIINGFEGGLYKPQEKVTRAQFIKLLTCAADCYVQGYQNVQFDSNDKSGEWYEPYVSSGIYSGIIKADDVYNGFKPSEPITRGEAAVWTAKAMALDTLSDTKYSDITDDTQSAAASKAAGAGIITGYEDGTFKPDNTLTRAEAAALIKRISDKTVAVNSPVVMTLGDISVTQGDLLAAVAVFGYGYDFETVKAQTMQNIINVLISSQIAVELGIKLNNSDAGALSEAAESNFGYANALRGINSRLGFISMLITASKYEERLYQMLYDERGEVSAAEALDYFKNNYFRAKHILVEDEKLLLELKARAENGEDFDALMKQHSTDPGSQTYPDGYVFTYGEMVREFEDCVTSLEYGELGTCQSSYGMHLVKRLPLGENDNEITAVMADYGEYVTKAIADAYAVQKMEALIAEREPVPMINEEVYRAATAELLNNG